MVASAVQTLRSRMAEDYSQNNPNGFVEDTVLRGLEKSLDVDFRESYHMQALAFAQMLPHLDFGLGPYKAKLRWCLEDFLREDVLQFEYGPMGDWFDELNQISFAQYAEK